VTSGAKKMKKCLKVQLCPSLTILGISLPRCRHKILLTTNEIIHKRISFKELTKNARKMKEKDEIFYQPKGGTFESVV
jgi:hypothetical protein